MKEQAPVVQITKLRQCGMTNSITRALLLRLLDDPTLSKEMVGFVNEWLAEWTDITGED